jgi:hypothetical protein
MTPNLSSKEQLYTTKEEKSKKDKYVKYRHQQQQALDYQKTLIQDGAHDQLLFRFNTSASIAEFYHRFFKRECDSIRFDKSIPDCLVKLLQYRSPSRVDMVTQNAFLAEPLKLKLDLPLSWVEDWSFIVVAGGIIHNSIVGDYHAYAMSDLDFFFIAPNLDSHPDLFQGFENDQARIEVKIKSVLQDTLFGLISCLCRFALANDCKIEFSDNGRSLTVMLTANQIASHHSCHALMTHGSRAFQFIYGHYGKNIYDVLDRFDIVACKFAWNGQQVFASVDAKVYLEDFTIHINKETISDASRCESSRYTLNRLSKYCGRTYVRHVIREPLELYKPWPFTYYNYVGKEWLGLYEFAYESLQKLLETLEPSFDSEKIISNAFLGFMDLHETHKKCIHSVGKKCQCGIHPQSQTDIAELRTLGVSNTLNLDNDDDTFKVILGKIDQKTLELLPYTLLWWQIKPHKLGEIYQDGGMTEATCGGFIGGYTFCRTLPHCIVFCDTWNNAIRVIHLPSRTIRTLYCDRAVIKAPTEIFWADERNAFYVKTNHNDQYFMVNQYGSAVRVNPITVVEDEGVIHFLNADSGFLYGNVENAGLNLNASVYTTVRYGSDEDASGGPRWIKACPLGLKTRLTRTMDYGMIITFDTSLVYTNWNSTDSTYENIETMTDLDWTKSFEESIRLWGCQSNPELNQKKKSPSSFIGWYKEIGLSSSPNARPGWPLPCDFSLIGYVKILNNAQHYKVIIPVHWRLLMTRWPWVKTIRFFSEFVEKTLDLSEYISLINLQHIVDMLYDGQSQHKLSSKLTKSDDFLTLQLNLFDLKPKI